eukprot:3524496-Amphidinium_carterae.1
MLRLCSRSIKDLWPTTRQKNRKAKLQERVTFRTKFGVETYKPQSHIVRMCRALWRAGIRHVKTKDAPVYGSFFFSEQVRTLEAGAQAVAIQCLQFALSHNQPTKKFLRLSLLEKLPAGREAHCHFTWSSDSGRGASCCVTLVCPWSIGRQMAYENEAR